MELPGTRTDRALAPSFNASADAVGKLDKKMTES